MADRHALFATALRMALRARGLRAYELPADDAPTMLAAATTYPTGLVLLDLTLSTQPPAARRPVSPTASLSTAPCTAPDLEGGLVRALCAQGKQVLVSTANEDEPAIADVITAGAVDVLSKNVSFEHLLDVVDRASRGLPMLSDTDRQYWLQRHRQHHATRQALARRFDRLSPRERVVLDRLAQGRRAADISAEFAVAMTTVRTQIRSILAKLEVTSQLEAVALVATTAGTGLGTDGLVGQLAGDDRPPTDRKSTLPRNQGPSTIRPASTACITGGRRHGDGGEAS